MPSGVSRRVRSVIVDSSAKPVGGQVRYRIELSCGCAWWEEHQQDAAPPRVGDMRPCVSLKHEDNQRVPPRHSRNLRSYTLWTMRKDGHMRVARTRVLASGDRLLELAMYERRTGGWPELLWAQTVRGGDVYTLAQHTQREYEGDGWQLVIEPVFDSEVLE